MQRVHRGALTTLALTVSLASFAAACEADADAMSAAACDAYADLQAAMFTDPTGIGPAATAFADAAPEALSADATTISSAFTSDDPAAAEAPAFIEASDRVGDAVFDDCTANAHVDVTGVDYAFADLPDEVDAGRLAIRLTNESAAGEPHELLVVTGANGEVTRELRAMPIEQLFEAAVPVGGTFASAPSSSATTLIDLEPGEYLIICTLPVGSHHGPEGDGTGQSHADRGMTATLRVR